MMHSDTESLQTADPKPILSRVCAVAKKKLVVTVGRALVSVCLLGFLLTRIDTAVFLDLGRRLSPWSFLFLVALFVSTTLLGSWRWKYLLECHALKQSLFRGAYLYLGGYFFNNFLPTSMGGDIMRGFESSKKTGNTGKVFSSIVVERLLGLLASITSALVFLPVCRPPKTLILIVSILSAASWGGALLLILLMRTSALDRLFRMLPAGAHRKAVEGMDTLRQFLYHPKLLFKSFLVSFLYQASLIVVCWTCARMAGIDGLALQHYLVFVPVVWVIVLVPVSLNSLGVSEVSFSYFFSLFGAPKEQGVLVSLMFLGTTMIASLVGGILWGTASYRASKNADHAVST